MNISAMLALIGTFFMYIVLRVKVDELGERAMRRIAEEEGQNYKRLPRFSLRLLAYNDAVGRYCELLEREGEPVKPAKSLQLYSRLIFALSVPLMYVVWTFTASQNL